MFLNVEKLNMRMSVLIIFFLLPLASSFFSIACNSKTKCIHVGFIRMFYIHVLNDSSIIEDVPFLVWRWVWPTTSEPRF